VFYRVVTTVLHSRLAASKYIKLSQFPHNIISKQLHGQSRFRHPSTYLT